MDGLWVRMRFRDEEVMDGILPNNLLQLEPYGFTVTPPEPYSNNQRVFVPRAALAELQVLGVVGSPCGPRKAKPVAKEQIGLFDQTINGEIRNSPHRRPAFGRRRARPVTRRRRHRRGWARPGTPPRPRLYAPARYAQRRLRRASATSPAQAVLDYRATAGLPASPQVDAALLADLTARPAPNPLACRGYLTLALDLEYTALLGLVSLTTPFESGGRFACLQSQHGPLRPLLRHHPVGAASRPFERNRAGVPRRSAASPGGHRGQPGRPARAPYAARTAAWTRPPAARWTPPST